MTIPTTTLQRLRAMVPMPPLPANASQVEQERLITAHVAKLKAAIDALALPPISREEMKVEPALSQDSDADFLAIMIRSARIDRTLEVAAANY